MNPSIYLIVLNWNMPKDTIECVESLRKQDHDNCKILIIDNASEDDSVNILKNKFRDIEVITNEQNLGFAGGNNVGIRLALVRGADYVFILNNDVTLDKNCLKELIGVGENEKNAGMLAPKVYYYDHPKVINSLGTSMDWFRLRPYIGRCGQEDNGQFGEMEQADILLGCALLVKSETIRRIGLIDEKFFIFHEEADWCLRNKKSGYKNIVVPRAVVFHKASLTMKKYSALTNYYNIRNFLYLTHKEAGFVNKIKVMLGLTYLSCKNMLLFLSSVESRRAARSFFLGFYDYIAGNMGKCRRTV